MQSVEWQRKFLLKMMTRKMHIALAKVMADKDREVKDGHDGTWVAHPGLVYIAKGVFDSYENAKSN